MPKQISTSLPAELRRVAAWLDEHPDIHAGVIAARFDTARGTSIVSVTIEVAPSTLPDRMNSGWAYWDGYGVTLEARLPRHDPRWSEIRESWHRETVRRGHGSWGGRDA